MSTRGYIGLVKEDRTVDYVYSHFDNYTTGTGYILLNHAKTQQDVERILENGWQDSVDYLADPTKTCRSYGDPKKNIPLVDYLKGDFDIEYCYLFDPKANVWYVATGWAPEEDRSDSDRLQSIFKLYKLDFFLAYELYVKKQEGRLYKWDRNLLATAKKEGILSKETIAAAQKLVKQHIAYEKKVKEAAEAEELKEAEEEFIPLF